MEKMFYTLLIASIGGLIGLKLKIPAGTLIGSMIFVAVFNISTGNGEISRYIKIMAQIALGAVIGLNFTMDAIIGLKKLIVPAFILIISLMVFCVGLGILISKLSGLDLKTALFSCAPGGLTDMAIIAEAYGAIVPSVVLFHLMRVITVIIILPFVIKYLSNKILI